MPQFVKDISFAPRNIIITFDSGPPKEYSTSRFLHAFTHLDVTAITALANMFAILIRTLIDRKILDESFVDSLGMDWDLDHIIYAIEQMGGTYHEPDLDNAN